MPDKNTLSFLELIKPDSKFSSVNSPPKPDYSNLNNWAALPEIDGQQFYVPDSSFNVNKTNNKVDVFYIHPTGYYEKTWNSSMDKTRSAFERTEIMLGNQASVFNETCNIFAPEYRQATYYSFFDKTNSGQRALDLAYSDVENSFDYFISNLNNNRPFIIYAHSQGALHAYRLIHNKINSNKDLYDKFICAYSIGYIFPEKNYFDILPNIPPSTTYNDIRCLISWSTVVEGFKRNREKTLFWTPSGWTIEPMNQKIIATNAFSWTNDNDWYENNSNVSIINKASDYDFTDRLRSRHTGTTKSIGLTRLQGFEASLNNETGLLETRGEIIENIKKMKFFNGDLHSFDVMLFWGSIRKNIKDRIDAYFSTL